MVNLDSIWKSRDITLPTKVYMVKCMVFPVVMYGCQSWTIKKAEHQRIDAFEWWCWWKLLSPLDCKKIKPVNKKINQSWIFIGSVYAEVEDPILWPTDAKNWLTGKDPDARKDSKQEEKGTTEDEMVWGHHWLDGHEVQQFEGFGDGKGKLACCSPWGHKELDITEWLNWLCLPYFFFQGTNTLISCLQSQSVMIWEPKKIKSLTVSIVFPSICHEVMGLDAMTLVFWMLILSHIFTLLFHLHQESLEFLLTFCH